MSLRVKTRKSTSINKLDSMTKPAEMWAFYKSALSSSMRSNSPVSSSVLKRLEFAMDEFAAHYSKTTNPAAVGMVHVIPFRKATGEMIFKVGKSSFELRKSDTTRIPLVRCLERYRSIMLQGDLQCVGMPFLFLTSSSGRAQDIEGHLARARCEYEFWWPQEWRSM